MVLTHTTAPRWHTQDHTHGHQITELPGQTMSSLKRRQRRNHLSSIKRIRRRSRSSQTAIDSLLRIVNHNAAASRLEDALSQEPHMLQSQTSMMDTRPSSEQIPKG